MKNCENGCIHNRVCGLKEKYEQYAKEFNELSKKWDIFDSNPVCPEYMDKSSLAGNKEKYEYLPKDKNVGITYSDRTDMKQLHTESRSNEVNNIKPKTISVSDENISVEDIIRELKKMDYFRVNKNRRF